MTVHDKFIFDMEQAGIRVREYDGRWGWSGPAVVTSEDVSEHDIYAATDVPLQSDDMGLWTIYYPVAREGAIYRGGEEDEE